MTENEIQIGDAVTKRFEEVRAEEIKMMTAITRDPNPIHFDRKVVEEMGMPGLVNQGASNLSYFVQGVNEFVESPAELVDVDVRFESQVFEGDSLETVVTVDDVRTRGETTIYKLTGEVAKDDGTVVLTGNATVKR